MIVKMSEKAKVVVDTESGEIEDTQTDITITLIGTSEERKNAISKVKESLLL